MNEIIKLTLKNLEEIFAFDQVCFPLEYNSRETWIELIEDPGTLVFSIKDSGNIAALISIYNWKGQDDYIKIMTIATHPDQRGKGHAHRLMQYIINEMLKEDMRKFRAETRESNLKMQKVFEDFGYKNIDKVDNCYENPAEAGFKYALDL